jgi:hypothetical protein
MRHASAPGFRYSLFLHEPICIDRITDPRMDQDTDSTVAF